MAAAAVGARCEDEDYNARWNAVYSTALQQVEGSGATSATRGNSGGICGRLDGC